MQHSQTDRRASSTICREGLRIIVLGSLVCAIGCGRVLGADFESLSPRQQEGGAGQAGATGTDIGGANTGGSSGDGCTSHAECIEEAYGAPVLCREHECVPLTTERECPVLLGGGQNLINLDAPDPIVFGVYADSYFDSLRLTVPSLNYELAIDEVNTTLLGGLSDGPGRPKRPFLAVLCDSTPEDLSASLSHLIDDLGVSAIIGPLSPTKLLSSFEEVGRRDGIFFMEPDAVHTELAELDDDDLVWSLRGTGEQLAHPYAALVERADALMQERRSATSDSGDETRLALVVRDDPVLEDLAIGLESILRLNGRDTEGNAKMGAYLRLDVTSESESFGPDSPSIVQALLDFAPHIVVSLTGGEYPSAVLLELENSWPSYHSDQVPPFHLLAPEVEGDERLLTPVTFIEGLAERLLGIAYAEPANVEAHEAYLSRLRSVYSLSEGGQYYDAAYYLMYSIAGAGGPATLAGADVAHGMRRLIEGETRFDVGPVDAAQVASFLLDDTDQTLELDGTQGPPNFDAATGVRRAEARVWCVGPTEQEGEFEFERPAMVYETSTGQFTGNQSCVPGF